MFISVLFFARVYVQKTLYVDVSIPITALAFFPIHVDKENWERERDYSDVSFMLWSWLHYVMWLLFQFVCVQTISTKQWHKQLCFDIENRKKNRKLTEQNNQAITSTMLNTTKNGHFLWQKCNGDVFFIFFSPPIFCRQFSLSRSLSIFFGC